MISYLAVIGVSFFGPRALLVSGPDAVSVRCGSSHGWRYVLNNGDALRRLKSLQALEDRMLMT